MIMSISIVALIAAEVSFMRMLGVGLTVAVLMDTTLVRLILVPTFMHVMGPTNWWAPAPLARLHRRFGIVEAAPASRCRSGEDGKSSAGLPVSAVPRR